MNSIFLKSDSILTGLGKPINLMAKDNRAVSIQETSVPTPESAVEQYERSGGKLKHFGNFGKDPLAEHHHLQVARTKEFSAQCHSFTTVFNKVVNNDPYPLRNSIENFLKITKRLAQCS